MASAKPPTQPVLASFVLRVSGRPARLTYDLHNVRTGERRRFRRADTLAAFLRLQELEADRVALDGPAEDNAEPR